MRRVFKDSVINVDYSENIIVIKNPAGTAQTVGFVLMPWDNPANNRQRRRGTTPFLC
jgi:arginine repressor